MRKIATFLYTSLGQMFGAEAYKVLFLFTLKSFSILYGGLKTYGKGI